jgi:SAM-dependent methyltransferase
MDERGVRTEYNEFWTNRVKHHESTRSLAQGWHFGYYTKPTEPMHEARMNMNKYINSFLPSTENNLTVLDAGCGVGSTLLFLAKKHPHFQLYGITLASAEVQVARKLSKETNLLNTEFLEGTYNDTKFPNEYFDCVYALESFGYSDDIRKTMKEMHRILKPRDGKLIILDLLAQESMGANCDRKTLTTITSCLKEEGFTAIRIRNLSKRGHVRHWQIYAFILWYSYRHLKKKYIEKIRGTTDQSQGPLGTFTVMSVLKVLSAFLSKPNFYSITSVKK